MDYVGKIIEAAEKSEKSQKEIGMKKITRIDF